MIWPFCVPEHIRSPACHGSENPGCDVSGGVDGIATIATQRNANEKHQETRKCRLTSCWRWFVLLVG